MFDGKIKQRIDQIVAGAIRLLRKLIQFFHQLVLDPNRKNLVTVLALDALFGNDELIFHRNHLIIIFPCFVVKIYVILYNITYIKRGTVMICTFFGHRDAPPKIKPALRQVLLDLIERQGVKQFYVGNQGNFDVMARSLLAELEQSHGIRYEIVLAYLPSEKAPLYDPDHTLLPEGIETVPRRFAIEYRNKWMIDHSDIVVTYVTRSFGGAAKFRDLAKKKGKTVIDLNT